MKLITIKECYHSCPFFSTLFHEMVCNHPKLCNSPIEKSMIITQENSRGRVPDECPLREDILIDTTVYELDGWKEAKETKLNNN